MSEEEFENNAEDQATKSLVIPFWKKVLVAVAVLFLIIGFSMRSQAAEVQEADDRAVATESTQGTPAVNGLVSNDPSIPIGTAVQGDGIKIGVGVQGVPVENETAFSYSPFFIKGGFSFLIAFCVGLAVRMFLKVTGLFIGVVALALFLLNKAGWVDVDWQTMSDQWDRISGTIANQADGLRTFITGSLPAAGLGALGLFAGFKKG